MEVETYCDRHPHFLAIRIALCEHFHRLCTSCAKAMDEKEGNSCPICHQQNQEKAIDIGKLVKKMGNSSKFVCFNLSKNG